MNTIVLMGRLARDPETKLTSTQKGQTKVSRFPLVVKRNRTSKAFVVMITAYGNNAEFVEKYLEKGIKIALSGELVISQIKDEQTGTASYYTEVIMDDVEFAEAKTKKDWNIWTFTKCLLWQYCHMRELHFSIWRHLCLKTDSLSIYRTI